MGMGKMSMDGLRLHVLSSLSDVEALREPWTRLVGSHRVFDALSILSTRAKRGGVMAEEQLITRGDLADTR
jgi:hypothetical protein